MPDGPVNHDVGGVSVHWRSPRLAAMPGVVHAFTGRAGGVSGPDGGLNLAPRPWDTTEAVATNWERAVAGLGPLEPRRLALVHQVHGAAVVEVGSMGGSGPGRPVAEADGLFTDAVGVPLAVRTADCVPVLLAAPGGPVAAVHAGWRGAAACIVTEAVRRFVVRGLAPGSLVAAIGPSIAGADYEVGDEVVTALESTGVPRARFLRGTSPRGRPLVDVAEAVRAQLEGVGVQAIDRYEGSTFRDPGLWSHRRDAQAAGRQAALIARVP